MCKDKKKLWMCILCKFNFIWWQSIASSSGQAVTLYWKETEADQLPSWSTTWSNQKGTFTSLFPVCFYRLMYSNCSTSCRWFWCLDQVSGISGEARALILPFVGEAVAARKKTARHGHYDSQSLWLLSWHVSSYCLCEIIKVSVFKSVVFKIGIVYSS